MFLAVFFLAVNFKQFESIRMVAILKKVEPDDAWFRAAGASVIAGDVNKGIQKSRVDPDRNQHHEHMLLHSVSLSFSIPREAAGCYD